MTLQERMSLMKLERQAVGQRGRVSFSVTEAAAMTGISRDMFYRAINRGELVAHKVGRRTIVNHRELERYLRDLPLAGNGKAA
jgi:excisionase family DNA binding protein